MGLVEPAGDPVTPVVTTAHPSYRSVVSNVLPLVACALGLLIGGGCVVAAPVEPPATACDWELHADNPLIEPPGEESLLGDPAVIHPDDSPDGLWHLFANSMLGIHRYVSGDGLSWELAEQYVVGVGGWRANVYLEAGSFHLLYEMFSDISHSEIQRITSQDLFTWSEPVTVITPTEAWELENQETVGNPYLTHLDGQYWLYYSAAGRELPDTGFPEPLHVGLARADSLGGPWVKESEPILAPTADDPWRNHGAGSLKLLDERSEDGRHLALNNGIFNTDGETGSAIRLLTSDDGLSWELACPEPLIAPTGSGWTAAFIYGFDTVRHDGELRLYFNARDGWEEGTERIGLATSSWRP